MIEWGSSAINWHQCLDLHDKEVVEILPVGFVKTFPGFTEFTLSYGELKQVISNPDANKLWHTLLSAVAGIYLITDLITGEQYVGSAYGQGGILGRWKSYTATGHGGNKKLKELLKDDAGRIHNLQFSVLATMNRAATKNEAIALENSWKEKLGSRAHGLNAN